MRKLKIIVSGGGTGGHIFPAISIADALKRKVADIDILFVGAEGRMEMDKVPAAGYRIIGLPVAGIQRKLTFENLKFPFKLLKSLRGASKIVKEFKPDVVIGVGGYASYPVLRAAAAQKIPVLIQEQNSFAGLTNKILGKKASKICVAYDNMDTFFPSDLIIKTGNPVRSAVLNIAGKRNEAALFFGINPEKPTIVMIGGSLGARTLNQSLIKDLDKVAKAPVNFIWQTGKYYYSGVLDEVQKTNPKNIKVLDFISCMDMAYSIADVIISRAGACSISELCIIGKPVILVPSPNVAEDHQTMNAKALSDREAAIMISDAEAPIKLVDTALALVLDKSLSNKLSKNLLKMALYNSDDLIANEVLKIVKHHEV